MLKHMQDGAEFNMLVGDSGDLVVVCSKCKKVWTGKLTLVETPISARKVTTMFSTALKMNPTLLKDMGMDAESIAGLKF